MKIFQALLTVFAGAEFKRSSETPSSEMASSNEYHKLINYDIYSENLKPPSRQAYLHVPEAYNGQEPVSLIVALHGKAQPPTEFADHTRFPAFGYKGLVVFPEGIKVGQQYPRNDFR